MAAGAALQVSVPRQVPGMQQPAPLPVSVLSGGRGRRLRLFFLFPKPESHPSFSIPEPLFSSATRNAENYIKNFLFAKVPIEW